MMKDLKFVMCVVLVIGVAAVVIASEKTPEIAKLLPAKNDVRGWEPVAGSLLHGSNNDLTSIYNGACPELRKQGFVEAVQQIYQSSDKKLYMEVIVNKLRTERQAKAYFEKQRKALGGDSPVKIGKNGQMFLVSKKPVQGLLQVKGYVVSAVPMYDENRARNDSSAFLRSVAPKLEKAK